MYKVKNPYKNCHIMDMNMMDISAYKTNKIKTSEIVLTCIPLLVAVGIFLIATMPEMTFMAHCQNIPGGDTCYIGLK